jgi:DnaJ homolog subfamily B member 12
MEVNKDEAERCKSIATSSLKQGQYEKAVKFLKKSLSLYPLPGVEALLVTAERAAANGNAGTSSATGNEHNGSARSRPPSSPTASAAPKTNNATASPNPSTAPPPRTTSDGVSNSGRSYTSAQVEIIQRILRAKDSGRGAHYRVLEVSETCTEADLKKSYRKIALKVHPGTLAIPSPQREAVAGLLLFLFGVLVVVNRNALCGLLQNTGSLGDRFPFLVRASI